MGASLFRMSCRVLHIVLLVSCLTACERKADVTHPLTYSNAGLEFQYPRHSFSGSRLCVCGKAVSLPNDLKRGANGELREDKSSNPTTNSRAPSS